MYKGIGDTSTTDLSSVSNAITGASATCDSGYSYSASLGTCVANSGICPTGYTFNAVSGVCEQGSSSFTAWLSTGNNGAYAALAAVVVVVVFGMMAKR